MRVEINFNEGVVTITFSNIEDNVADRSRICNIELALLKSWGSHKSSAWTWDSEKRGTYAITRKNASIATMVKAQEILHSFNFKA